MEDPMFWNRKPKGAAPTAAAPATKSAGTAQVENLSPEEVYAALQADAIVLVDVREPGEHAAERIEGSTLHPLVDLNPSALPVGDKPVVLYCAVGRRSAAAAEWCIAAGVPVTQHLAGGLQAWKAAGLPTT